MGLVLLKNCSGGKGKPGEFNANTLHYVGGSDTGMQLVEKDLKGISGLRANAFKNQNISSIEIPSNIRSIGANAFNTSLNNLKITPRIPTSSSSTMINMEAGAFANTAVRNEINITNMLGWLQCSFGDLDANPLAQGDPRRVIEGTNIYDSKLVIPEGVERIRPRAFCHTATFAKDIVGQSQWEGYMSAPEFPQSLTTIATEAFKNSIGGGRLVFPDSVSSVSTDAFNGCGAYYVYFGASFPVITFRRVFGNNPDREQLEVSADNTSYYSIDNCIFEKYSHTLVWGAINSVIPTDNNITTIGSYAFMDLSGERHNLKTLTIPDNITTIEAFAFKNNSVFNRFIIGSGITTIGSDAFNECVGLLDGYIEMQTTITSFGARSFANIPDTPNFWINIQYNGTKQEFKNTYKSPSWLANSAPMMVYCTDGQLEYYQSNRPRDEQ